MPSIRNLVQTLSTNTPKLLCCFIDPLCALLGIADQDGQGVLLSLRVFRVPGSTPHPACAAGPALMAQCEGLCGKGSQSPGQWARACFVGSRISRDDPALAGMTVELWLW